jgi:hypothetical protein
MEFLPLLEKVDSNLRSCLEYLLNIRLNEIQWLQASLPISRDGFGIRKTTDIYYYSLSPFTVLVYQVPCGRLVFSSLFFPYVRGLRGTLPGHPRPPSLLLFPIWTTQHEIQHKHPWEAHPAWDLNPADLAVVSEECRSCFHHPTVSP